MNNTILAGAPVGNKNAAGKRKFLHPEIAQRHALEDHEVAAATKYLKGERTSAEFDRLSATVSQAIDDHEHFERTGTMKASEAQEDNVVRAVGTSEGAKKGWEKKFRVIGTRYAPISSHPNSHWGAIESFHSGHDDLESAKAAAEAHQQELSELYGKVGHISIEDSSGKEQARLHGKQWGKFTYTGGGSGKFVASASDTTSTEVIHCRASSAAGEKLATGAFPLVWQEA